MALDTGHSNGSKNNTCRKRNWLTFDEGNSRGPGTALDAFLKKRVETMNHGGMKQPSPVLLNHATERSPLSVIDCYSNQFPVVTSQRISKGVRHRGPNLETLFKDRGSVENTPGVKRRSPNTDTLFDDRGSVEKTPAVRRRGPNVNTLFRELGCVENTPAVRRRGPNVNTLFRELGCVENTPGARIQDPTSCHPVKQNKPSRYFASGSGTKNLNLKFNEASDASLGTYLGHENITMDEDIFIDTWDGYMDLGPPTGLCNPLALWNGHWKCMSEDILIKRRHATKSDFLELPDIKEYTLAEIECREELKDFSHNAFFS
ncbi:hypothetical protein ACET3Z_028372 [Daucus carota]